MEAIKSMLVILLSAVLVNNYVLVRFLGICPFLGVSKKLDQASGMGVAVTVVMLLATAATWPIQKFILDPLNLGYMQTIVFIVIIASLVQMLEIVLKKFIPSLHAGLGVYLPLITTNCAVLGVAINNINDGYNFIESMKFGYKCLMRSAEIAGLEEIEKEEAEKAAKAGKKDNSKMWMNLMMVGASILGVVLALFLFIALPTFIYSLVCRISDSDIFYEENRYLKSVFEGIFKVVILVGYMSAISLMKDIRRTFMFHGAEHKTIFCYESGEELTVENVRKQKRFHPRCGTSFLILMVLVSILIGFFIPPELHPLVRVCVKLLLFPLTMGLGYELIKFAGKYENIITKIISAPGVGLQRMTVFEPDDSMIECAIAAMKEVIPEDGSDKIN